MEANAELNNLIRELYYDDILDDDDVVLLLDGQRYRGNLHLEQPYSRYPVFDLGRMEDRECEVEFRFTKREIYQLVETFELPEQIRCYSGTVLNSIEALCVCLKRFAYPCRYVDLIPRFRASDMRSRICSRLIATLQLSFVIAKVLLHTYGKYIMYRNYICIYLYK